MSRTNQLILLLALHYNLFDSTLENKAYDSSHNK